MRPLSDPRLFAKSCLAATMGLALTLSAAAPASAVQPPADETGIVTSGDTAKDVLSPGMKKRKAISLSSYNSKAKAHTNKPNPPQY